MATPNMFDLLNDDAQDQEIQIPAVKKAAPAPAPKAQPGTPSKPTDNRGPRKEGARPPRRDNEDRGGKKKTKKKKLVHHKVCGGANVCV